MNRQLIFLIVAQLCYLGLLAQPRIYIEGEVTDATSGSAIAYANIHFQKNKIGTTTDINGYFSLNTNTIPDTLIVSAVGFSSVKLGIFKYSNQSFKIELEPAEFELDEVVIRPGENPALRIMRNVIDEKTNNNPLNIPRIACNTYTKILVKTAQDFSELDISSGIPIYFSEKISQNLIQHEPYIEQGKIIDQYQTGLGFLEEMSIIGYSNNMSLEANFYDNIIELFDKPFISPLNSRAFLFYQYILTDSIQTKLGKEFVVEFKPRNIRDLAFKGYMHIVDDDWSISEILAEIPRNANLNYVNSLKIRQTFIPVNDSLLFFHSNETDAELKITKDQALLDINFSAQVQKKSIYDHVLINFEPILPGNEEIIWDSISPANIKRNKNNFQVHDFRPEELTIKEEEAIATIDSLNDTWKIRSADALSKMFITGYLPGELFDLGPYLELVKNNKIEGYRYTFAGRTSSQLTKNTMLYGHIGYGTRDEEWKYGFGVKQKLGKTHRKILSFEYRNDLSRIGDNRSIFLIKENMMVTGEDNVIASIFTNSPLDKLSREISFRFEYENEWKTGISTISSFNSRKIHSGIYLPFVHNGDLLDNFLTNELMLGLRLSWKQNYTDNYCRRYYLNTNYPIVHLRVTGGQYQLAELRENYLTARGVINHDVNIGQTKFEYILESGLTIGTVPFALLDISRTNQSLGYALFSFNMMDEMEFASDRFVSLMTQYHLNGLIMNRIPVLKQLGIREVLSAKVLWSHLDEKHQEILDYPVKLYDARFPYAEISAGIENFFQYFRFDLVWRLPHANRPASNQFGIRARFDVKF